jgi:hypothetical protein
MASWPTTLPNPQASYSLSPVDQTIATDMDSGAARVRRRTTARNDHVDVLWQFSDAQYVIFRAWFNDSTTGISGGASWFTMSLPVGDGGMTTVTARFSGPHKANYISVQHWSVSGKLELR